MDAEQQVGEATTPAGNVASAGDVRSEAVPAAPAASPTPADPKADPKAKVETKAEPDKPSADHWAKVRAAEERTRREREETKAEAKKIADERAEIAKLRTQIEEQKKFFSLEGFGGDPVKFLEHHKLDYDDITRRMLNRPVKRVGAQQTQSPELAKLRAELDELKASRAEEQKQAEARAQEGAWGRVLELFEEEIAPPTEGDHAFELVHQEYAADPDYISATLREMARIAPELTVSQAAARLEDYFLNQTKSRLGLKKVKALLSSEQSGETKPSTTQAQQAKSGPSSADGPRTLSHRDTSERSADADPPKPLHEMTLKERREWERHSEARAAEAWAANEVRRAT
jgi:hypothetical protein